MGDGGVIQELQAMFLTHGGYVGCGEHGRENAKCPSTLSGCPSTPGQWPDKVIFLWLHPLKKKQNNTTYK